MKVIKSFSEFINEDIHWTSASTEDYQDENQYEEEYSNKLLQDKINERIKQTNGSVLDLRDLNDLLIELKPNSLDGLFNNYDEHIPPTIKEIDVTGWDLPKAKVKDVLYLFSHCNNIEKITGLETWDVSGLDDMSYMFYDCTKLEKLDLSNWDVSKVRYAGCMFKGCINLKELNISTWDTSNFRNLYEMFYDCKSLTKLDISNWNIDKVRDVLNMFYGCSNLRELNLEKWNFNHWTLHIRTMFKGCDSLIKKPSWWRLK